MSAYRAALLALLVVGASVAAIPAGATGTGDDASDSAEAVEASGTAVGTPGPTVHAQSAAAANDSTNNSSFGADISSFMQSSTAEVGGAVETGMWTAAYNGTDNRTVRTRLVERQTGDLHEELAELRERRQELFDEREAGNLSDAAYKARVGQLVGQINALNAAINATESRAREVNGNVENVTRLRTETAELSGPEIAAVARNLTGVGNGAGGPPSGVGVGSGDGTPGDGDAGPGNGSDTPGNSGDSPGNSGDVPGNRDDDPTEASETTGVTETTELNEMTELVETTTANQTGAEADETIGGGSADDLTNELATLGTGTGQFTGSVSAALDANW